MISLLKQKEILAMNSEMFKAFGIFCFSIVCFGLGTLIFGALVSFSNDDDSMFCVAWLTGTVIFGITMMITYG